VSEALSLRTRYFNSPIPVSIVSACMHHVFHIQINYLGPVNTQINREKLQVFSHDIKLTPMIHHSLLPKLLCFFCVFDNT
jgi:hypothetical protein